MRNLRLRRPLCFKRRTAGTLLLMLPLSGSVLLWPCAVQAQPRSTTVLNASPQLPGQAAELSRAMAIAQAEEVCYNRLDLKMENATLPDLTRRIQAAFPAQKIAIETRSARPVRLSFDLPGTTVGTVLQSAAALANCKLWVFEKGLLISPASELSDEENAAVKANQSGEWIRSVEAGGSGWSNQRTARRLTILAAAQEVATAQTPANGKKSGGIVETSFGNFSPESQQRLQLIATWFARSNRQTVPNARPFFLSANSLVTLDTSQPEKIVLGLNASDSDGRGDKMFFSTRTPKSP